MSIYDELGPVVSEILGSSDFKKETIQLLQITPGAGPADNPGPATETVTEVDGTYSGVNGEFVKQGLANVTDLEVVLVPIDGVTLSQKDFIVINAIRYKIIQDMSIYHTNGSLVWKLIIRAGA